MRRDRFHRQPLFSSIPGSFPWILVTIVAVAVSGLRYQLLLTAPVPSAPLPVVPQPAQIETRISALGHDRNHRSLPFTVYVLTHQLSWKLQSAADLEGDQLLLNPELIAAINAARDVFCVGTASFEGSTRSEEARAAQRARKLAQWVGAVIQDPKQTHVFTLNAGQYEGPVDLHSTEQRKAIIIITGPHHKDVDLGEGLTSGLEQQQRTSPFVFSLLHHYSRSNEWLKLSHASRKVMARRKSAPRSGRLVSR